MSVYLLRADFVITIFVKGDDAQNNDNGLSGQGHTTHERFSNS